MSHCNLVHKPISMHQALNIQDARAAVDKDWSKHIPAWQETQVKSKPELIDETLNHGETVGSFCHAHGPTSSQ